MGELFEGDVGLGFWGWVIGVRDKAGAADKEVKPLGGSGTWVIQGKGGEFTKSKGTVRVKAFLADIGWREKGLVGGRGWLEEIETLAGS
jgi:hypothetical protein